MGYYNNTCNGCGLKGVEYVSSGGLCSECVDNEIDNLDDKIRELRTLLNDIRSQGGLMEYMDMHCESLRKRFDKVVGGE